MAKQDHVFGIKAVDDAGAHCLQRERAPVVRGERVERADHATGGRCPVFDDAQGTSFRKDRRRRHLGVRAAIAPGDRLPGWRTAAHEKQGREACFHGETRVNIPPEFKGRTARFLIAASYAAA